MEIRKVIEDDFEEITGLIIQFAEEALNEYGTHIDPAQVQKTFDKIYETSFVGLVDGKVVGVLAGQIVEDVGSTQPAYEEVVWFMEKGHRGKGMQLFTYVQQWCIVHDIGRMLMSCMHNSKTEMLFKIYKAMGFEPMETRFVKVLGK